MLKHHQTIIILLLFLFCITNISNAKISSDEAKKLGITGTPLTPVGAERAANKDGTIPQWNGGVIPSSETNLQKQFPNSYKVPSTYKNGNHHPCPFKESGPLFTITSENYEKYKDKKILPAFLSVSGFSAHAKKMCKERHIGMAETIAYL